MKNNHIKFIFMRMVVNACAISCFLAVLLVKIGVLVQ